MNVDDQMLRGLMSECKTPTDAEVLYTQPLQPEHGTAFNRFTTL